MKTTKKKPKAPVCGAEMLQGLAGRRELGYRPLHIKCSLPPGHTGNHLARLPSCGYSWRGEQDIEQAIEQAEMHR